MDDFTGTTCGNNVKYPLIGAMREELLGVSRGKDAKDVDWEKVAASFDDLPVRSLSSNSASFVILIANFCRRNQSQSKSMFQKFYRKSPSQKRKSTRKSSKDKQQSKREVIFDKK